MLENLRKGEKEHNRLCPHCRKLVIPSEVPGYVWQCLECDEDFYDIECYKVKEG